MCSGAAFLVGLFLLFRGPFRVANRNVPRELSRQIALILMAPVIIGSCAAFFMLSSVDGASLSLDDPLILRMAFIEIAALIVAVGIALWLIYRLPMQGAYAPSMPTSTSPVPSAPPNVMTPAEAARYLRITEAQVRELIDGGQVPAARIGNDYRIARIALDDFLSHNKADDNEDFAEFRN